MLSRYHLLIGAGAATAAIMAGGTVFAAQTSSSEPFIVTNLALAGVTSKDGTTTVDVNITVEETGNESGTWEFPDPSVDYSSKNPVEFPTLSITDTTTNTLVTSAVTATALLSSPDPALSNPNTSATAEYAFVIPTPAAPGDTFSINLVNQPSTTNMVFHMIQPTNGGKPNTAPVYDQPPVPPITGQLPEVPWAAMLPLIALGAGVIGWRRRALSSG
ncbi:MAG: hypothetical protein OWU84_11405 [Firmicutes bacterium]|nr:hypothetical protein [Bacillota bacterium]